MKRIFYICFILSSIFLVSLSGFAQTQKWVHTYDSAGKPDEIRDVALDDNGNIYVAGYVMDASYNADLYVAKYDPAGNLKWSKTYDNGPGDWAFSLAVRGSKIYVTGGSHKGISTGSDYDIVTFILDTAGTTAMTNSNAHRYDHESQQLEDEGYKVMLAPSPASYINCNCIPSLNDTFFVAGIHTDSATTSRRITVLMYDTTGLLHENTFPGDSIDEFIGMEVVNNQTVYVLANAILHSDTGSAPNTYAVAKFGKDLGLEWVRRSNKVDYSVPTALAADESGVYVTGTGAICERDVVTAKYDPAGTLQWVARSYRCNYTQVSAGALLLYHNDVFATGYHANGSQYFRYNRTTGIEGHANGSSIQSYWSSLHVDSVAGDLYAAGNTLLYDQPKAWHLARFNSADSLLWEITYDGSGTGDRNVMNKMVISSIDSSVVMVGTTTLNGQQDMLIAKYAMDRSNVLSIKQKPKLPLHFALHQNYPNPFNPTTKIGYALPSAQYVSLKIYDMLGREVTTLVDEKKQAGTYTAQWDATDVASGMYFYKLTAGTFVQTKKMLLLK